MLHNINFLHNIALKIITSCNITLIQVHCSFKNLYTDYFIRVRDNLDYLAWIVT